MHSFTNDNSFAQHDELAHRVTVRLQNRLGGQLRDLRVTIQSDGLILQGRVRTYYGKQLAQHVAMEESGQAIAANEIEVL